MEQLGWKSDWERQRFPLDQAKSKDNEKKICTLSQIWRQRSKDNTDFWHFYNTGNKETKKQVSKYAQNTAYTYCYFFSAYLIRKLQNHYRRVKIFKFKIWEAF